MAGRWRAGRSSPRTRRSLSGSVRLPTLGPQRLQRVQALRDTHAVGAPEGTGLGDADLLQFVGPVGAAQVLAIAVAVAVGAAADRSAQQSHLCPEGGALPAAHRRRAGSKALESAGPNGPMMKNALSIPVHVPMGASQRWLSIQSSFWLGCKVPDEV